MSQNERAKERKTARKRTCHTRKCDLELRKTTIKPSVKRQKVANFNVIQQTGVLGEIWSPVLHVLRMFFVVVQVMSDSFVQVQVGGGWKLKKHSLISYLPTYLPKFI